MVKSRVQKKKIKAWRKREKKEKEGRKGKKKGLLVLARWRESVKIVLTSLSTWRVSQ